MHYVRVSTEIGGQKKAPKSKQQKVMATRELAQQIQKDQIKATV
jgi:hypothetical protein